MAEVAMQIQLHSDDRLGTHDVSNTADDVFLAAVVPLSHHGAEVQQHDLYRHGRAQIIEQFVAQGLIGGSYRDAGRLRPSHQAEHERITPRLGLLSPSGGEVQAGCWIRPSSASFPRCTWKSSRLVGIGENVLVSVAIPPAKIFTVEFLGSVIQPQSPTGGTCIRFPSY